MVRALLQFFALSLMAVAASAGPTTVAACKQFGVTIEGDIAELQAMFGPNGHVLNPNDSRNLEYESDLLGDLTIAQKLAITGSVTPDDSTHLGFMSNEARSMIDMVENAGDDIVRQLINIANNLDVVVAEIQDPKNKCVH